MKASELRIGNLVLHKGSEVVVNGISPHCNGYAINTDKVFKRVITDLEGIETIVEEVRPTWVYLKKCIPIQLTKEWLLRFLFHKKPSITLSGDLFIYDIGRDRRIVISNIDNGDQMVTLQEYASDDYERTLEIIELWNFDDHGLMPVHKLQNILFDLTGEELTYTK